MYSDIIAIKFMNKKTVLILVSTVTDEEWKQSIY